MRFTQSASSIIYTFHFTTEATQTAVPTNNLIEATSGKWPLCIIMLLTMCEGPQAGQYNTIKQDKN